MPSLIDFVDVGVYSLTPDDDVGNQDKYTVYLLGSKEIEIKPVKEKEKTAKNKNTEKRYLSKEEFIEKSLSNYKPISDSWIHLVDPDYEIPEDIKESLIRGYERDFEQSKTSLGVFNPDYQGDDIERVEKLKREFMGNRTLSLLVTPEKLTEVNDFDTRGVLIDFTPFSLSFSSLEQAEPMIFQKVRENDYEYYVVHLDLEQKDNRYVHTGKKHYLSPSIFRDEIPKFSIPKKDFDEFLTDISIAGIEFTNQLRQLIEVYKNEGIGGIFDEIDSSFKSFERVDRSIEYNDEVKDNESPFEFEDPKRFKYFYSMIYKSSPAFINKCKNEFKDDFEKLEDLDRSKVRKEHKKFPIFGQKKIDKVLWDHDRKVISSYSDSKLYKTYNFFRVVEKSLRPAFKNMFKGVRKYAVGKQENIDLFLGGRKKFEAKREYDDLEVMLELMDPPMTKKDISDIHQMFARGCGKLFYSGMILSSTAACFFEPRIGLGMLGLTLTDYLVRSVRKRHINKESAGIIGISRDFISNSYNYFFKNKEQEISN